MKPMMWNLAISILYVQGISKCKNTINKPIVKVQCYFCDVV